MHMEARKSDHAGVVPLRAKRMGAWGADAVAKQDQVAEVGMLACCKDMHTGKQ